MHSVLPAGSVVIYDSTLLHHGGPYHNGTKARHMAYFTLLGERGYQSSTVRRLAIPSELAGTLHLNDFTQQQAAGGGGGGRVAKDEV